SSGILFSRDGIVRLGRDGNLVFDLRELKADPLVGSGARIHAERGFLLLKIGRFYSQQIFTRFHCGEDESTRIIAYRFQRCASAFWSELESGLSHSGAVWV